MGLLLLRFSGPSLEGTLVVPNAAATLAHLVSSVTYRFPPAESCIALTLLPGGQMNSCGTAADIGIPLVVAEGALPIAI